MSVTAIVISCGDWTATYGACDKLDNQTVKPDETIVVVCCNDISDYPAEKILHVPHQNLWGHEKIDYGIRLAEGDYVFFYSADDDYDPTFIEKLSSTGKDLVLGGFQSHLAGTILESKPETGQVTRGSFMIKTDVARNVGYTGRTYSYDGQFVKDVVASGADWVSVPEILHYHN